MIFFIYNPPGSSLKTWPDLCVGAIGDVSEWSYEKLFCGVGTFELIVPIEAENADKLKLNRILMSTDGEFIIKQLQYSAENITVSGYDLNGILLDRLTVAMSEDGKDKVSGSTETIVKHFVDVNCVSSDDEDRNFPGLTIETDKERGIDNDAASPRLECVADVISNILSAQRMGWRISAINTSGSSSSALFRFYVYEAVNRTWGQTKNNPVTFSYGLGNANSIKTEKSMVDLKNTLYCELDDGTVQTYSPDDDNEGFDRTEEYTDLGCELSELEVYAEHEIADRYKPVQNVTLEHVDPSGYATGTGGFNLGDIVTVVDDRADLKLEALITAIKIKRSGNEFDLDVTIGETRTKLIDRVAKKAADASTAYKGVSTAIKSEIASGSIGGGSGIVVSGEYDWVGTVGGKGIRVENYEPSYITTTYDSNNHMTITDHKAPGVKISVQEKNDKAHSYGEMELGNNVFKVKSSGTGKMPYNVLIGGPILIAQSYLFDVGLLIYDYGRCIIDMGTGRELKLDLDKADQALHLRGIKRLYIEDTKVFDIENEG